jgi:hypothetical protein
MQKNKNDRYQSAFEALRQIRAFEKIFGESGSKNDDSTVKLRAKDLQIQGDYRKRGKKLKKNLLD